MIEIEAIMPMLDCRCPKDAGGLLGECWAATLESAPRYPHLDAVRHAPLLRRIDCFIQKSLDEIVVSLPSLGFDDADIAVYRKSALRAFRASMPPARNDDRAEELRVL